MTPAEYRYLQWRYLWFWMRICGIVLDELAESDDSAG